MADEKPDEILLTVDIDEGAVEARLVELRKRSNELRAEKDLLRKANKEGKISADEYAAALTKNKVALNENSKEIRDNERTLAKNTQQHKAAAGSITQMRAQVSLLYADFANLSKEERNNAQVGGVLQKQLKDLNDELKESEASVGDNRRTVGGYAEAIEGAISKNTNFVSTLGDIRAKLGEAQTLIKSQVNGYKDMTDGMGTTQKASVALGLGLKAIGIGLLITAITSLIGFLSRMDAGMDKIEQATAALSAGFEAFIQTISPIGELIVETFTHPLDAIGKLGDALLHPIDSFTKIREGAMKMADDVAANTSKAARAAVEYTQAMQDSEDAQDKLISQQAKVNQQVTVALLAAKDRSKTEQERIALLDKAGKAEAKLSADVLKIRQDELNALVDFQKSKAKLQDADVKKMEEAKAAVTDAETSNLETQQKIANRRSALIEQEAADRKADAEKAKQLRKDAITERIANAERELLIAKQTGDRTLAIEEKLIALRAAADSVEAKGKGAKALIAAKAEADTLKLRTDYIVKNQFETLEARRQGIDAELALVQKGTLRELELRQQGLRLSATIEKNAILQEEKNAILRDAKLAAVDARLKGQLKDNQDAFNQQTLARQQELANLRLQTEENLSEQTLSNQRKFQAQRIDLEEEQALASLKLTELTEQQRLVKENEIRSKAIRARKELDETLSKDTFAATQRRIATDLAGTREGSRASYKLKVRALREEEAAAVAAAKDQDEEVENIRKEFSAKRKKLAEENFQDIVNGIANIATAANNTLSTFFAAQEQEQLRRLDREQQAALESAGANADLRVSIEKKYQKDKEKLQKEAAEKQRKIASVQNIINGAVAVTKAFAENGPILGAVLAALTIASTLAQQSIIDSQTFAEGGVKGYSNRYISDGKGAYVRGPGSAKSDSINAKISNGESILTAKATTMFYDQLSAMNVAGGGRAFPGAGDTEVPRLSNFAAGGVPLSPDSSTLVDAVIAGMKSARLVVAVTDIHSVESDMTYAEARGNI